MLLVGKGIIEINIGNIPWLGRFPIGLIDLYIGKVYSFDRGLIYSVRLIESLLSLGLLLSLSLNLTSRS
jgi:hypothetical protein